MANDLTDSAKSNETRRPGIGSNLWRCAKRGFAGCIYALILVPLFLSLFLVLVVVADYSMNSNPVFASVDVLPYVPGFVTMFLILALFMSWMSVPLLVASPVVGMLGGLVGGGVGSLASNKKAIDIGATVGGILLSAIYLIYLVSFFKTLFVGVG